MLKLYRKMRADSRSGRGYQRATLILSVAAVVLLFTTSPVASVPAQLALQPAQILVDARDLPVAGGAAGAVPTLGLPTARLAPRPAATSAATAFPANATL